MRIDMLVNISIYGYPEIVGFVFICGILGSLAGHYFCRFHQYAWFFWWLVPLSPRVLHCVYHSRPLWLYLALLIWISMARRALIMIYVKGRLPWPLIQSSSPVICQLRCVVLGRIEACVQQFYQNCTSSSFGSPKFGVSSPAEDIPFVE